MEIWMLILALLLLAVASYVFFVFGRFYENRETERQQHQYLMRRHRDFVRFLIKKDRTPCAYLAGTLWQEDGHEGEIIVFVGDEDKTTLQFVHHHAVGTGEDGDMLITSLKPIREFENFHWSAVLGQVTLNESNPTKANMAKQARLPIIPTRLLRNLLPAEIRGKLVEDLAATGFFSPPPQQAPSELELELDLSDQPQGRRTLLGLRGRRPKP